MRDYSLFVRPLWMTKLLSRVLLSAFIFGCSHYQHNLVKISTDQLVGGRLGGRSWQAPLSIYRYSWYSGATMIFEANIVPIPPESPFRAWFDQSESSVIQSCRQLFMTETYHYDSKKINPKSFADHLQKVGFKEISASYFVKSWVNHPHIKGLSNSAYKFNFYCLEQQQIEQIDLSFPGYELVSIRLI